MMQPFHIQFWDLLLIQLTNWRWSWRSAVTTGLVAPVGGMLAFAAFAEHDITTLGYILTGNLVFSLLFTITNRVSSNFAFMRVTGMLDFFAVLPVYRAGLILASAAAFLLLAIPTVLAVMLVGWLALDVPLSISPAVALVIPLVGLALCGLGAFIGTLNRPPEEIASLSTLVSFFMLLIGPVMLPPDRLPAILRTIGYLSPATYAASALRHVLLNQNDATPLLLDTGILVLVMAGLLWFSARRMVWRQPG